ncbi:MAG: isoprenylcysteine carboxylmethyltransferase family protein [Terracidiphilus sp.]|nr:isoprenylcysteine carboxylmethyltransferase family protein [Terracidiphilus sp.]
MSTSLLWHVLFYGWTTFEILIAVVTRTRRGGGNVLDRGSMAILWVTIVVCITAGEWIAAATPENMFGGAHWLKIAAIVVLIAGLAIRWTAILSLGKAFSANVAIRDAQTVHQSGLYRLVRHPSYTGLLLVFVAVTLDGRNWLAAALVLAPTTAALLYRIHVEEAALNAAFGAQYEVYIKKTKRLIPGIY